MTRAAFKRLFLLCVALYAGSLHAQDLAAWRGAWIADIDDARYVLYLVLRDGKVSGTFCHDCANPDRLAFVDDGAIDAAGLHYNLYFSSSDGSHSIVPVDAQLEAAALRVTLKVPESETWSLLMHRAPPQAVPPPVADARPNQPAPGRARELPGAPQAVTADKVLGLWLWGTGPTKQYFMFKRHKDGVRGLVCGPCDSAKDFAPLENIRTEGTSFHFEIVHEDNGIGYEEHGPFSNVTDAQLSLNEMHMTTFSSFDPNGRKYEMTLLGPAQYMPPAQQP
jgi:hypothetical protein